MKLQSLILFSASAAAWVVFPEQNVLLSERPSHGSTKEALADTISSIDELLGQFYGSSEPPVYSVNPLQDDYLPTTAWLSSMKDDMQQHWDGPDTNDHALYQERLFGYPNEHGHHGYHGHHEPNLTVYQLIASSKYTTKLAKLIEEDVDLVKYLNSTNAGSNITVFAPTDRAFEKIPEHAPRPSKDLLKRVLSYHVSPEFFPAGRVLVSHTIPTLLEGTFLSQSPKDTPQRLSTNIGLKGLTVNYYSRVVAVDILGTNGVIHGVDSILVPPPKAAAIIQLLPTAFSTLELGLLKTGLLPLINDTSTHLGGTLFAPSNFAFQKLGPKANAFLFSHYGQKYLKALLKYHIVANQTLYSDAYYKVESATTAHIPKGLFHVDLPTLLHGKHLSIDIFRYGRYINMKVNGFASVALVDGIAKDGVIHTISNVLIPPKELNGRSVAWQGEPLDEMELVERLTPFMDGQ